MSKKRVKAIVRVVLDIEDDSVWGGDCTFEQIAKQAEDGVKGLLTNGNALALKDLNLKIRSLDMLEVRVVKEATK